VRRLVIIAVAAVAAGGIAVTPALAGLHGNPSFSQQIPVPAPSQAKQVSFPGDDHGGLTGHPEPADDRGSASPEVEPGDDHGGLNPTAEPGDDRGGLRPAAEPGDDRGGSGSGSGRSGS